jgi:hypothetical protein
MSAVVSWNPAEFDDWYIQQTDERKAKAWDSLRSDQRKIYTEWWTFGRFARVAPLDIDPRTIENREPPEPDVICQISHEPHYFELGEVTDESVAQKAGIAAKQGRDIFSGTYSHLPPLMRIFEQKCFKTYATHGRQVHLLLHYSVGHQVPHTSRVLAEIIKGQQDKLQQSPFASLWLYDGWSNSVISYVQR